MSQPPPTPTCLPLPPLQLHYQHQVVQHLHSLWCQYMILPLKVEEARPGEEGHLSPRAQAAATQQNQPRYPTNTVGYTVLYCNRFIIIFTQVVYKKQTNTKNKHFQFYRIFKSTVQLHTAVARREQERGVTDWRRERRWEMVELKDCQQ